ncbi:hypothetical protein JCM17844_18530 [Iodidimonas gelatinilytica]|uniref:Uncharacterized protein n=1 Tax=Iodidimonas gelatinilytica TaxID=1236966 RepID=A0A5A7MQZ3_9PROT|nr:hypothetical protein JCM17844_18530 [Iodidimonas gelatinilytica]
MDAISARNITGGGHHAAITVAANDQRFVCKAWIVAFFHRRIKCIAIHMGNAETVDFRMVDMPGAATIGAPPCRDKPVMAIAA